MFLLMNGNFLVGYFKTARYLNYTNYCPMKRHVDYKGRGCFPLIFDVRWQANLTVQCDAAPFS